MKPARDDEGAVVAVTRRRRKGAHVQPSETLATEADEPITAEDDSPLVTEGF